MAQGGLWCARPWQEVQAYRSSSSLPSLPPHLSAASFLGVSPQRGAGGALGQGRAHKCLLPQDREEEEGWWLGPCGADPSSVTLWMPPSLVLCVCCQTIVLGTQGWKKMDVFSLMCLEMCKSVVSDLTKLSLLEVRQ